MSTNPVPTYLLDTATPLTMVLAETTGSTPIKYLHGLGLVAQSDGTNTNYLLNDGLGTVRQVVNPSGTVQMAQTFDPYGNPFALSGPTTSPTSFGFSGSWSRSGLSPSMRHSI